MLLLNRPTPVLIWLSFNQSFQGSGRWKFSVGLDHELDRPCSFIPIAFPDFQNVEAGVVKSCSMVKEGVARF